MYLDGLQPPPPKKKKNNNNNNNNNNNKRINRGNGQGLEIAVICKIYGGRKYLEFGQTRQTYSWKRDCKGGLPRTRK